MTDQERPSRMPRWVVPVLIALAIAALAFAVGRFSTFGSGSAASATPTNDSAEAGFARDMQVHHAQAVEMAMEIYRKTDDDIVRMLSYDIATGQSAQRGQMYQWLVQWGLPQAGGPAMAWMTGTGEHSGHGGAATPMSDAEAREAMGMATDAELSELGAASGTEADCLFLSLMISHHEGAIPMAEAVLELGSEPGVLTMAQSMKDTQTAEIDAMESSSARLGCS
ncbi:DUF305 domain-containing protein [Microbacterium sp. BWT-B31]|uniref:DUF305 domain-containing protein n=1 Tax=Microbacterium sp. BWT-B31 TaxID=3232072 RepID=UPI003527F9A7